MLDCRSRCGPWEPQQIFLLLCCVKYLSKYVHGCLKCLLFYFLFLLHKYHLDIGKSESSHLTFRILRSLPAYLLRFTLDFQFLSLSELKHSCTWLTYTHSWKINFSFWWITEVGLWELWLYLKHYIVYSCLSFYLCKILKAK